MNDYDNALEKFKIVLADWEYALSTLGITARFFSQTKEARERMVIEFALESHGRMTPGQVTTNFVELFDTNAPGDLMVMMVLSHVEQLLRDGPQWPKCTPYDGAGSHWRLVR